MLSYIMAFTPYRNRKGQAKRVEGRKEKTLAFYGSVGHTGLQDIQEYKTYRSIGHPATLTLENLHNI